MHASPCDRKVSRDDALFLLLRLAGRLFEDHVPRLPVTEAARAALMIRHDFSKALIQFVAAFFHRFTVLEDEVIDS
jgi:hypothetical protein